MPGGELFDVPRKPRLPRPYRPPTVAPTYTFNVSASADAGAVVITALLEYGFDPAGDPRRSQNVMVWVDGQFIVQSFTQANTQGNINTGVAGVTWNETRPTSRSLRLVITLNRSVIHIHPGRARVTVNVFDNNGGDLAVSRTASPLVPGTPTTPALPSVPSGQPIRSDTIVRTLFWCDKQQVVNDGLLPALQAAGINTLSVGAFNNPGDNPGGNIDTYEKWDTQWIELCKSGIDYACEHFPYFLLIGDDFLRNNNERVWYQSSDFSAQATARVATYARDTGKCVGLEAIDEQGWPDPATFLGGPKFIAAWRSVPNAPGMAWPAPGVAQPPYPWEDPAYADYSSRYWVAREWRYGRPVDDGLGIEGGQIASGLPAGALSLPSWPWYCLIGSNGAYYLKRGPGVDYIPFRDKLYSAGTTAQQVIMQAWLALAYGASGLRFYAYDFSIERNNRRDGGIPSGPWQTGARPGLPLWDGVHHACRSVADREASLLSAPYTPVVSWPWVVGKRASGITWLINCANRPLVNPFGPKVCITPHGETVLTSVPAYGVAIL